MCGGPTRAIIEGMKTIAIAGGLLASAALLSGCGLAGLGGPTNQDTVTYEVADKVAKLHVKSGSGDTVITETGGNTVRVVETLQWRDTKPDAQHSVDGDTLFIRYDCEQNWGSCSVNYKIEVPKGLQVDADAGSGDITLRSLTGPLNLTAGSGDVDASGLAGKKVFATAGSGTIELKYTTAPDSAELEAGSGDVTMHVPDGAYDVVTKVGSGDTNVTVDKDPGSPRKVSLTTGSGDASVLAG
jgi:Putative adhesin